MAGRAVAESSVIKRPLRDTLSLFSPRHSSYGVAALGQADGPIRWYIRPRLGLARRPTYFDAIDAIRLRQAEIQGKRIL